MLCFAPSAKAQGSNYPAPLPYMSPNQVQALMEEYPEFRNLNRRRSDNTIIISFQQYGEHAFSVPLQGFFERYGKFLGLGPHDEMRLDKAGKLRRTIWPELALCDSVHYYRQYHKNYTFKDNIYEACVWTSKGKMVRAIFDIKSGLDMDTIARITPERAIQIAKDTIKAKVYRWEVWSDYWKPTVKKMYKITENGQCAFIYSLYISTNDPPDYWMVDVDAQSSEVLAKYHPYYDACNLIFPSNNTYTTPPCMKACYTADEGSLSMESFGCDIVEVTGDCFSPSGSTVTIPTLYYGCRDIYTDYCPADSKYYLRNSSTTSGNPILVNVIESSGPITAGFEGGDDFWFTDVGTSGSYKQDLSAASAFWAASVVYDCFKNAYLIDGFDNMGGTTEVWVNDLLTGALWDNGSKRLRIGHTYTSTDNPYVALDVIAHEYGHGVMANAFKIKDPGTTNFGEKRALHEGVADIFGITIERYAVNNGIIPPSEFDWYFAEDCRRSPERTAECPEESYISGQYPQADTYGGANWNNAPNSTAGAYVKAGVISHWFYLLAGQLTGSGLVMSGQNDLGNDYEVVSIGVGPAADIVMNALEVVQMDGFKEPEFEQFKAATMKAVKQMYGDCFDTPLGINHTRSVAHAWYAVGMGETDLSDVEDANCRCTITAGIEELIYIAEVKVGDIANSSLDEGTDGYDDFSMSDATDLEREQSFNPQLASVPIATKDDPIYWKIWIDHNRDGTFDSYEKVYAFKKVPGAASSGVNLPNDMPLGKTIMRIAMRVGQAISDNGCEDFTGGGVEDYEVNIIEATGGGGSGFKREPEPSVFLFPNPVQNQLHIRCAYLPNEQANLYLYNLNGTLISRKKS